MAVSCEPGRARPWKIELYRNSKRILRRYFRTERQAQEVDAAWMTEKATGVRLIVDTRLSPTFRAYVEDRWIESYMGSGKELPTWKKRFAELKWHAFPVFLDKRLADINAGDILAFQARMKSLVKANGKPLSSQTIKNARSAVSVVFEHAKSCELVSANPVRLLGRDQTKLKPDKPAINIWSESQVEQYLVHMATVDFSAYVAYQMWFQTGLRPGEIRGTISWISTATCLT